MTCKPQIPWLVHLVQQHQVQTAQNKHRCFYTSRETVKAQASTSQAISVQTKMAQGSEYWSKSLVHNLLSKMCLLGSDITKSSSSALKSHFILNSTSTTRHGFIIPPSGLHCTCFFFPTDHTTTNSLWIFIYHNMNWNSFCSPLSAHTSCGQ